MELHLASLAVRVSAEPAGDQNGSEPARFYPALKSTAQNIF
jgi:hypothetical protein